MISFPLLGLLLLAPAHADEIACQNHPVEPGPVYTIAHTFVEKEEFTYPEFSAYWKRVSRDKVNLIRLPTADVLRSRGPCGTTHYNPNMLALTPAEFEAYKKGTGHGSGIQNNQDVGSYLTDVAACRFMEVFQEWAKECDVFSADKNVCAISWGDAAHRDTKKFAPHSVKYHGFGDCIDIRPIKKGTLAQFKAEHAKDPQLPLYLQRTEAYKDWVTSASDTYFDKEGTHKLLELLKRMGASPVFFLDKDMQNDKEWKKHPDFTPMKGHANHIHACFMSTPQQREACAKFVYRRSVCGALLY